MSQVVSNATIVDRHPPNQIRLEILVDSKVDGPVERLLALEAEIAVAPEDALARILARNQEASLLLIHRMAEGAF